MLVGDLLVYWKLVSSRSDSTLGFWSVSTGSWVLCLSLGDSSRLLEAHLEGFFNVLLNSMQRRIDCLRNAFLFCSVLFFTPL